MLIICLNVYSTMLRLLLQTMLLALQVMQLAETLAQQLQHAGRRWWVRPHIREPERDFWSSFIRDFQKFKHTDKEKFYDYVRMTPAQFEYVYSRVRHRLVKRSRRAPLSPQFRLAITLQ